MSFGSTRPVLPVYASAGALLPIDSITGAGGIDPSLFPAPLVEMYQYQGVQYGLPRDFDTIALFFNRDLFDAAGEEYPNDTWTWEDFRAAAERLHEPRSGHLGRRHANQLAGELLQLHLAERRSIAQRRTHRNARSTSRPPARHSTYLTEFFTDELTPSIAIQQSNPVADTLFPAGQVAMMTGGSFRAGTYGAADANIDVAPLPQGKQRATRSMAWRT